MYSEALALFDRAVPLILAHPGMERPCGRTWQPGSFPAALDSCDTAIATDPGYFRAWSNRGWVLGHLGRNAEALDSCDRAIALRPDFAELAHPGWVLTNLGRTEALDSCDRETALCPDDVEAWNMRGNVLMGLGRYADALGCTTG